MNKLLQNDVVRSHKLYYQPLAAYTFGLFGQRKNLKRHQVQLRYRSTYKKLHLKHILHLEKELCRIYFPAILYMCKGPFLIIPLNYLADLTIKYEYKDADELHVTMIIIFL